MNHQLKKRATQFALALSLLSFTVVACKEKKKEEVKTPPADTATKMDPVPPTDTTHMDTATTRPVKTGD